MIVYVQLFGALIHLVSLTDHRLELRWIFGMCRTI